MKEETGERPFVLKDIEFATPEGVQAVIDESNERRKEYEDALLGMQDAAVRFSRAQALMLRADAKRENYELRMKESMRIDQKQALECLIYAIRTEATSHLPHEFSDLHIDISYSAKRSALASLSKAGYMDECSNGGYTVSEKGRAALRPRVEIIRCEYPSYDEFGICGGCKVYSTIASKTGIGLEVSRESLDEISENIDKETHYSLPIFTRGRSWTEFSSISSRAGFKLTGVAVYNKKEYNLENIDRGFLTIHEELIRELNMISRGDSYGFKVYDLKGEEFDSCWGFLIDSMGFESRKKDLKEMLGAINLPPMSFLNEDDMEKAWDDMLQNLY